MNRVISKEEASLLCEMYCPRCGHITGGGVASVVFDLLSRPESCAELVAGSVCGGLIRGRVAGPVKPAEPMKGEPSIRPARDRARMTRGAFCLKVLPLGKICDLSAGHFGACHPVDPGEEPPRN